MVEVFSIDLPPAEQQLALIDEYQEYLILMTSPERTPISEPAGNLWLMLLIFCAANQAVYGIFPGSIDVLPTMLELPGVGVSLMLGELYRAELIKLNGKNFLYIPEMVRRASEGIAGSIIKPLLLN